MAASSAAVPAAAFELKARAGELYAAGKLAEAAERYTAALAAAEAADGIAAWRAVILTNRGLCRKRMGALSEAAADFTAAIGLDGGNIKALFNRGEVLAEMTTLVDAAADFSRVLRLAPDNAPAAAALARVRAQQSAIRKAVTTAADGDDAEAAADVAAALSGPASAGLRDGGLVALAAAAAAATMGSLPSGGGGGSGIGGIGGGDATGEGGGAAAPGLAAHLPAESLASSAATVAADGVDGDDDDVDDSGCIVTVSSTGGLSKDRAVGAVAGSEGDAAGATPVAASPAAPAVPLLSVSEWEATLALSWPHDMNTRPLPLQRLNIACMLATTNGKALAVGATQTLLPLTWWQTWCEVVGGFSDSLDVAACLRILRQRGTLRELSPDDALVRQELPTVAAMWDDWRRENPGAGPRDDVPAAVRARLGPIDTRPLLEPWPRQVWPPLGLSAEDAALLPAAPPPPVPAASTWPADVVSAVSRVPPTPLYLRRDAMEGRDFVLLPDTPALALYNWYGGRGPVLRRAAIADSDGDEEAAPDASSSPAAPRPARGIIDLFPELRRPERNAAAAAAARISLAAALTTGSDSSPSAGPPLSAIDAPAAAGDTTGAIVERTCYVCGHPATAQCPRCRRVYYCGARCAGAHADWHRLDCGRPAGTGLNGLCGLANLGNTCFMNSALQALSACWPLTRYFLSGRWREELNTTNTLGSKGRLATAYAEMIRLMWLATKPKAAIPPSDFKRAIGRFHERFSGFAQQDAQELLAFVMDGLHEDLNRVRDRVYVEDDESDGRPDAIVAAEAWEKYQRRNRSVVADMFAGQLKSTLVCPTCERVSVKFDPYTSIALPLPTNSKRGMLVRLERTTADLSRDFYRWLVPTRAMRNDPRFCSRVAPGADPLRRRHRLEVVPLTLDKQARCAAIPKGVAGAAKVAVERLFIFRVRGGEAMDVSERAEVGTLPDGDDTIVACELLPNKLQVPLPGHTRAAAGAGTATATAPAGGEDGSADDAMLDAIRAWDALKPDWWPAHPDGMKAADTQRCLLHIDHMVPSGKKAAATAVDPRTLSPDKWPCRMLCLPTILSLPRGASLAHLRYALAVAVLPMLHRDKVVALLAGISGASEAELADEPTLIYELARALPLSLMGAGSRLLPKKEWLPSFDVAPPASATAAASDVPAAAPAPAPTLAPTPTPAPAPASTAKDGRTMRLDTALRMSAAVNSNAYLHLQWRERWAGLVNEEWAASAEESTEVARLRADVASRARKLDSRSSITLLSCWDSFTRPETLDELNMWYCNRCRDHVQARKTLQIWSLPDYLVLQLKRFEARNLVWRDKIEVAVDFPLVGLDLNDKVLAHAAAAPPPPPPPPAATAAAAGAGAAAVPAPGPYVYDCVSVVNHSGNMMFGHYTASANHDIARGVITPPADGTAPVGQWLFFNDSSVAPMRPSQVVSPNAYIIVYKRRGASDAPIPAPRPAGADAAAPAEAASPAAAPAAAGATAPAARRSPTGTASAAGGPFAAGATASPAARRSPTGAEPSPAAAGGKRGV